jgi:hypothetical protein
MPRQGALLSLWTVGIHGNGIQQTLISDVNCCTPIADGFLKYGDRKVWYNVTTLQKNTGTGGHTNRPCRTGGHTNPMTTADTL